MEGTHGARTRSPARSSISSRGGTPLSTTKSSLSNTNGTPTPSSPLIKHNVLHRRKASLSLASGGPNTSSPRLFRQASEEETPTASDAAANTFHSDATQYIDTLLGSLKTPTSPPMLHGTPLSPPIPGIYPPLPSPPQSTSNAVSSAATMDEKEEAPAANHGDDSSHDTKQDDSSNSTALVIIPTSTESKEHTLRPSSSSSSRTIIPVAASSALEKQRPAPISIPSSTGTVSVPSTGGGQFTALSPPIHSAVSFAPGSKDGSNSGASTALIVSSSSTPVPQTPVMPSSLVPLPAHLIHSPPPTAGTLAAQQQAALLAARKAAAIARAQRYAGDDDNDTYRDSFTAMVYKRAMILQSIRPEPMIGEAADSPANTLHMARGVHSFAQLNSLSRMKVASLYHETESELYLHEKKKRRDQRREQRKQQRQQMQLQEQKRPYTMMDSSRIVHPQHSSAGAVVAAARAVTSHGSRPGTMNSNISPKRSLRGLVRTPSVVNSPPVITNAGITPAVSHHLRRLSSSSGASNHSGSNNNGSGTSGSPASHHHHLSGLMAPTASSLAHAAAAQAMLAAHQHQPQPAEIPAPSFQRSGSSIATRGLVIISPPSPVGQPSSMSPSLTSISSPLALPLMDDGSGTNSPMISSPGHGSWTTTTRTTPLPTSATTTRTGTLPLAIPHSLSQLPRAAPPQPLQPHSLHPVVAPPQPPIPSSITASTSSPVHDRSLQSSHSLPRLLHSRPTTTASSPHSHHGGSPNNIHHNNPPTNGRGSLDRSQSIAGIAQSHPGHNPLGLQLLRSNNGASSSSSSGHNTNTTNTPSHHRTVTFGESVVTSMNGNNIGGTTVASTAPPSFTPNNTTASIPPLNHTPNGQIVEEESPSLREYRIATNQRFGHVLATAGLQKSQVREAARPAYNNLIKPITQLDENRLLRRKLRFLADQQATRSVVSGDTSSNATANHSNTNDVTSVTSGTAATNTGVLALMPPVPEDSEASAAAVVATLMSPTNAAAAAATVVAVATANATSATPPPGPLITPSLSLEERLSAIRSASRQRDRELRQLQQANAAATTAAAAAAQAATTATSSTTTASTFATNDGTTATTTNATTPTDTTPAAAT